MHTMAAGILNLMVFLGLGAVWLGIRTNPPTDWLTGIGFLLVASAFSALIATVRQLAQAKASKAGGP